MLTIKLSQSDCEKYGVKTAEELFAKLNQPTPAVEVPKAEVKAEVTPVTPVTPAVTPEAEVKAEVKQVTPDFQAQLEQLNSQVVALKADLETKSLQATASAVATEIATATGVSPVLASTADAVKPTTRQEILTRLNAITDPKEFSAFYSENRSALGLGK